MINQIWLGLPDEVRSQISEFHFDDQSNSLKIYTIQGTEVRFGDVDRLDEKLRSIPQVLEIENDMEEQGTDVLEYVDIRFQGEAIIKTKA